MPTILILLVLTAFTLLGGYFFSKEDTTTAVATPTPITTTKTDEIIPGNTTNIREPGITEGDADSGNSLYNFKDGEYTADTTYVAPGRASHTVGLKLTIVDDIVTATTISFGGDKVDASSNFQNKFATAYQAEIIGKKLSDIELSRVAGASLTTEAFNKAKAQVATQAQM
jgi:hypothetical protein